MLGDRKPCALIYALAFTLNLALCITLISHFGKGDDGDIGAADNRIHPHVTVRRHLKHYAAALQSAA
jgi:hypothetical protein